MARLSPVLSALLRQPTGFVLVGSQVALTLALVANATLIVVHEDRLIGRPSGLDESHLFVLEARPESGATVLPATVESDLAVLRRLPDVISATRINTIPLGDGGWRTAVDRAPIGPDNPPHDHSALFFTDDKGPQTLGLRLLAGRFFTARDVRDMEGPSFVNHPTVAIISAELARALFPGEDPVGKLMYTRTMGALSVIGVVEHLQSAWPSWPKHEQSMLLPARLTLPSALYVVRVRGAAMPSVMDEAVKRLLEVDSRRLLGTPRTYEAIHATGYRDERSLAMLMAVMIAALLFVTIVGVVGTSSFRVASRTRQIGTRRALGATRTDIVRHFLAENLAITGAGALAGTALAYALNSWLAQSYGVPPLPWPYAVAGAAFLVALGLLSALGPALKAAGVPPIVATKTL